MSDGCFLSLSRTSAENKVLNPYGVARSGDGRKVSSLVTSIIPYYAALLSNAFQ